MQGSNIQPNLKSIFLLLVAVDVVIIAGVSLWLGAPDAGGCACPAALAISKVSLWHNGSATFTLHNYGTIYFTITQVRVSLADVENSVSVSIFSGNVVSYKSALNLTVFFSSFEWHDGVRYQFTLTDSQSDHFVTSIVA